jgi:hypothetical protein
MNIVGTIKRVRKEDNIKPKITEPPKARHISLDIVIGKIPKIVQMEVIKMASN